MKRNTLVVAIVFLVILGGTIVSLRVLNLSRIERFVNERNELCANLTFALQNETEILQNGTDIHDCYCYFEGFKTDKPAIDDNTLPLCACECVVNGTIVKIGLLEPV